MTNKSFIQKIACFWGNQGWALEKTIRGNRIYDFRPLEIFHIESGYDSECPQLAYIIVYSSAFTAEENLRSIANYVIAAEWTTGIGDFFRYHQIDLEEIFGWSVDQIAASVHAYIKHAPHVREIAEKLFGIGKSYYEVYDEYDTSINYEDICDDITEDDILIEPDELWVVSPSRICFPGFSIGTRNEKLFAFEISPYRWVVLDNPDIKNIPIYTHWNMKEVVSYMLDHFLLTRGLKDNGHDGCTILTYEDRFIRQILDELFEEEEEDEQ